MQHDDAAKYVADGAAASVAAATVIGWLPAIAAVLTIIWTLIRIYESDTVQKLLGKK